MAMRKCQLFRNYLKNTKTSVFKIRPFVLFFSLWGKRRLNTQIWQKNSLTVKLIHLLQLKSLKYISALQLKQTKLYLEG